MRLEIIGSPSKVNLFKALAISAPVVPRLLPPLELALFAVTPAVPRLLPPLGLALFAVVPRLLLELLPLIVEVG